MSSTVRVYWKQGLQSTTTGAIGVAYSFHHPVNWFDHPVDKITRKTSARTSSSIASCKDVSEDKYVERETAICICYHYRPGGGTKRSSIHLWISQLVN